MVQHTEGRTHRFEKLSDSRQMRDFRTQNDPQEWMDFGTWDAVTQGDYA